MQMSPQGRCSARGSTGDISATLDALVPRLRSAGIAQLLGDAQHGGFLSLSSRLHGELKERLNVLLGALMQGSAAYRLRGVVFSPELSVAGSVPNTRLDTPNWKAVIDDCDAVRPKNSPLTVSGDCA